MVRGACYVRVSTDNQLENYSIEEQTDRLKAYCVAKDIHIVQFYTDGGYSGGSLNRPALQKMLADIDSGSIDIVIVYKLDRLSRSQKDTLTLIEDRFLSKNVDFLSVSENFDTSNPFGRAMIGILSVFAQLEKDQITERFTMGRIGRAKNGYFHGGAFAPTGYDYIDGKLVVNEYEALQIQELYSRFLEGYSIHNCWKYMQSHYTTKYGAWKSETLVRGVLQNELYTGKVKFNHVVYPGQHQPIITAEQFQQVQKILSGSRRSSPSPSRSPFRASTLLSGLIRCGRCGARFHGEHGNYSCYSRTKGDKHYVVDPNCKNKKWKIPELDALVKDCVTGMKYAELKEPSLISTPALDFTSRLEDIEKQTARLVQLFQVGSIPLELVSSKLEALSQEKAALQSASDSYQNNSICGDGSHNTPSVGTVLTELFETGSLEEKRACLTMLIDKVVVNGEEVAIVLKEL